MVVALLWIAIPSEVYASHLRSSCESENNGCEGFGGVYLGTWSRVSEPGCQAIAFAWPVALFPAAAMVRYGAFSSRL